MHRLLRAGLLLSCGVLAGCSLVIDLPEGAALRDDAGAPPDPDAPDARPDGDNPDTTMTVEGRLVDMYYDTLGRLTERPTAVPDEVSLDLVFSADGDPAELTSVELAIDDDGRFSVPDVPAAQPYYVRLSVHQQRFYYEASGPELRIENPTTRRGDTEDPADGSAFLWTAQGMPPWQDGDELALTSPSLMGSGYLDSESLPAPGATELDDARFEWFGPRVEQSRGDQLFLWHLTSTPSTTGFPARGVAAVATAAVEQRDGETAIHSDFDAVSRTYSYEPQLDLAALLRPATEAYPDGLIEDGAWHLLIYLQSTAVVQLVGTNTFSASDTEPQPQLGTFSVYNDYGRGRMIRSGIFTHKRRVTFPGTTDTATVSANTIVVDGLGESSDTMSSRLGPPRQVRINGAAPFTSIRVPFGDRPRVELSWDEPASGTPDRYQITVQRHVAGAGFFEPRSAITTRRRQLVLPPEIFESGQTYAITVMAIDDPSTGDALVLGQGIPYSNSEVVVGLVTITS